MKWLNKMNRGAILFTLILLGVIVYLVGNSMDNKKNIPIIKEICENYIQMDISYSMLPEKYRDSNLEVNKKDLDAYKEQMRIDYKGFFPDGEDYSKFTLQSKYNNLDEQATYFNRTMTFSKRITSFDKFEFVDGTVTVTVVSDSLIERISLRQGGSVQEKTSTGIQETEDEIILMKINGEWKIIYAQINEPYGDNYYGVSPDKVW